MTKTCQSVGCLAAFLLAIGGFVPLLQAADSLGDLREEARTPSPPSPSSGGYSSDDDCCECESDLDAELDGALGQMAFIGITSPFWAPPAMMSDDYDITFRFPTYPHEYRQGYMISDAQTRGPRGEEFCRLDLGLRASAEYGTNFSGIDWVGGRFLLENSSRFGVDADFRVLEEQVAQGVDDSLSIGDLNAFFRFAQSRRCTVRAGVGFNWLSDQIEDDFGANFTYAVDWYPRKPVIISGELDLGWLGDATLLHGRLTTGVNYRNAEAFVGYDYLRIGDFDLNGLVAGVRLWW
jgi:hypothetical protein